MDREEVIKKFEKQVMYLQRNVAPDDIYCFAEHSLMTAMFFMHKWTKLVDIQKECEKDPITHKFVTNILGLQHFRDTEVDCPINLDFMDHLENNNSTDSDKSN